MSNEIKAALIAAISAIVGTVGGGAVTYVVAKSQIDSNKQQAVDTFLLSQRQAAFAAFLTDAGSFFEDQYSYSAVNGPSKKALGNMIVADTKTLASDHSTIILVSPSSISSITREMSTLSSQIAFMEGLTKTNTPQPEGASIASLTSQFDSDLNKLSPDMNSLIMKD